MSGTAVLTSADEVVSEASAPVLSTGGETLAAINTALERCSCLKQWLQDGFADDSESRGFLLDLFYHNEDLFFDPHSANPKLWQAEEFVVTATARWLRFTDAGILTFVFDKGYL